MIFSLILVYPHYDWLAFTGLDLRDDKPVFYPSYFSEPTDVDLSVHLIQVLHVMGCFENSLILLCMRFTGGQENTILNNESHGQERECGNFTYNRINIKFNK